MTRKAILSSCVLMLIFSTFYTTDCKAQILQSYDSIKSELRFAYIGVGYSISDFHASDFQLSIANDNIEYKYGLTAGIGYSIYPVSTELNYKYGSFEIGADPYFSPGDLSFHAADASLLLNVFPYSKIIIPEIGMGYQFIWLESESTDLEDTFFASNNIQSLFWAGRIKISVINKLYIYVKYQHSFPVLETPLSFNFPEKLNIVNDHHGTDFISLGLNFKISQ